MRVEIGVVGESAQFEGVRGISHAADHGAVGLGINDNTTDSAGPGVFGDSAKGEGVRGVSHSPVHGGVVGTCDNEAAGVFGESTKGEGVRGVSHSADHAAVVGTNDNAAGVGIFGKGKRLAGQFDGNVDVKGSLHVQGVDVGTLVQRIVQLEQQGTSVGQLVQRVGSLEQTVSALQSQLNTATSNLTGRVTQAEVAISDLKARITALGG